MLLQHPVRLASTKTDIVVLGQNVGNAKQMPSTCCCTARNPVANAKRFPLISINYQEPMIFTDIT